MSEPPPLPLTWTCLICGEVHPIDHEGMFAGSWMICMGCEVKARKRMLSHQRVVWAWAVFSDFVDDPPLVFVNREDAQRAADLERQRIADLGGIEEAEIDEAARVVPLYPGFGHVQHVQGTIGHVQHVQGTIAHDELLLRFLRWRGVEDPCLTCSGTGRRGYDNTSTWRRGIGGASITYDVCDACWGSGDRFRSGADLRRLRNEEQKRIAEAAVDALATSAGATLSSSRAEVMAIVDLLRDAAKKAGGGRGKSAARSGIWFSPLAESLASLLELAARGRTS